VERDALNTKLFSLTNELELWGPAGREGELKRLVLARFAEYPVRRLELDSLYSAVQWSLQNPLGHLFTSRDALDVPSKPKGGRDEEAEGLFVFPPEKRPCRKRGLPDTHRPGALGARPSGYRSDGHGKLTTSIRITKKRAGGLAPGSRSWVLSVGLPRVVGRHLCQS